MTNPEEVEPNQEFEQKVHTAFHIQDPDQLFIDRLQKELVDRYKAVEPSTESVDTHSKRSPWTDKFIRTLSPLAWGAIAVILILSLIWGIKSLIPRVEVGGSIPTPISPIVSPSQSVEPTQAEGAEEVTNLPVLAGTPVPWPEEMITTQNAHRLTQLANWGMGMVGEIAWAPDGKSFAVAAPTGIHIYDAATFTEVNLIATKISVSNIAYSPDGAILAAGNNDYSITLWDLASGNELQTLLGHENFITRLVFSPDGEILASSAYEQPIKMWDVSNGQELRTLSESKVINFAFSPDGATLATTGGEDKLVRLWDVASGQELRSLSGHTDYVYGVAFSPDGSILATTSNDMTIRLWEVASGNELQTIDGQENITGVAFLPDGKTLASWSYDQPIKLLDLDSGEVVQTFDESTAGGSFVLSPDGTRFLTYVYSGNVITLMDVASGQKLQELDWQIYFPSSLATSPDGSNVVLGTNSGSIVVLDARNGQTLQTLTGHTNSVDDLAISPDGTLLASASNDGTIKLWDVAEGKELSSMEGLIIQGWSFGLPCVAFSPDGKTLAYGATGGQVRLWDIAGNQELLTMGGSQDSDSADDVSSVAFSPDGKILAAGYASGSITFWDPTSGKELRTLSGRQIMMVNNAVSIEFSPDGRILAAVTKDGKIETWDVTSGDMLKTFIVRDGQDVFNVNLAMSQAGDVLAAGTEAGTIKLWDIVSGQELITINTGASKMAFSPDGAVIVSASWDGLIRLWGVGQGVAAQPGVPPEQPTTAPVLQAIPEELGVEKSTIPILLTGEEIQPMSFSPDMRYFAYSQRGTADELSPDQELVLLNFINLSTGEICQGVEETVKLVDSGWGMYPEGLALFERTVWSDDNRLLYLNLSGDLSIITPCSDSFEDWSNLISDKLLSFRWGSKDDGTQILIRGEQAYWLLTPSTGQVVKLEVPLPPEGQETSFKWSPWEEQLISGRIDDRQGELWIVLEEINTTTGAASPFYEVRGSEELRNFGPMTAFFDWVSKDKFLIENTDKGMGLVDLSSQPPQFTSLFPDVFGIETPPMGAITGWGTMPHNPQQDYHLMIETGGAPDGQYYLYHPESGLVDQYPLDPPFLIVFPEGDGGLVQSYFEQSPTNDIFKVIFVDSATEPFDLVVKGHTTRRGGSLSASLLPGAEQVLFSSSVGISLVEFETGETTNFWEYENQEQYQDYNNWVAPDGKTVIAFANEKTPGVYSGTQVLYWLRLEP